MADGNGKAKTDDIAACPPMSDLAMFHNVVGHISDCVGDDHDRTPDSILCIVLREGEVEQFSLATPAGTLALLGALEVAKDRLLADLYAEDCTHD